MPDEETRARLVAIVEGSQDAIIGVTTGGTITSWNLGAKNMYGYSAEEAIGRPVRMLFPPDSTEEEKQLLNRISRGELVEHFETVRIRKDGKRITVSVSISPIRARDGSITGASKIDRDITGQKALEQSLRKSEERFRSLVTAMTQIVWTADARGQIIPPLPGWQEYTGQTDEEIRGAGWTNAVHPDDQERTAVVWTAAVESASHYIVEYRLRRHDGVYRTFAVRGVPVLDDDGSIREWVGTCTDVTERRLVAAERELRLKELTQSNSEWEQFGYVASHDLQEPLRAVANCVQLLRKRYGGQLDERADEFINHAVDGVKRMQSLIEALLAYSRLGMEPKRLERTDGTAVLRDVLDNLAMAIKESGATVTYDPLPEVMAERIHLLQLFQNLIGNAIKFRSAAPPAIHVMAVKEDGGWLFTVSDNGIGIDLQYAERIFRVFQRLHTRRHYQGTGIGLAICKKIVELYGGRIWVSPTPGGGCTFCFTFPQNTEPHNI